MINLNYLKQQTKEAKTLDDLMRVDKMALKFSKKLHEEEWEANNQLVNYPGFLFTENNRIGETEKKLIKIRANIEGKIIDKLEEMKHTWRD